MTTIEVVTYPWQTQEEIEREQAEAEILADAEFQQWFDRVWAGMEQAIELGPLCDQPQPDPTAGMSELEFLAMMADQAEAQNAEKVLSLTEEMLMAGWELLPDWQRDDYVGS